MAALYEKIGRLNMELDYGAGLVEKKLPPSIRDRCGWVEPQHPALSIVRQCELLGVSRSSYYYRPAQESAENLRYLRLLDERYLCTPFFGSRRMTLWLQGQGYAVNRKRVRRLMRRMGLEGVTPGPRTRWAHPQHRVYPYLLRELAITRPNQVLTLGSTIELTLTKYPEGLVVMPRRTESSAAPSLRAGTAEPFRVALPEAAAYPSLSYRCARSSTS